MVISTTIIEKGLKSSIREFIIQEGLTLEEAVEKCVKGRIYNNGETCIAAKRFIVVEEIFHFLTTVSRKKGVNLLTFQEPDLLHNFFII